ncbi:hypothetical protein P3L51_04480 [Streptomyces sp. PSRA5]|uniref:hypothetical protein n=1 Tax=Streptomyces panacea TaxID=3035064 RepID=UPI00339BFCF9
MPFSDVHLLLHSIRAAELRAEAAAHAAAPSVRPLALRARLGWLLVELGLRLVNRTAPRRVRPV